MKLHNWTEYLEQKKLAPQIREISRLLEDNDIEILDEGWRDMASGAGNWLKKNWKPLAVGAGVGMIHPGLGLAAGAMYKNKMNRQGQVADSQIDNMTKIFDYIKKKADSTGDPNLENMANDIIQKLKDFSQAHHTAVYNRGKYGTKGGDEEQQPPSPPSEPDSPPPPTVTDPATAGEMPDPGSKQAAWNLVQPLVRKLADAEDSSRSQILMAIRKLLMSQGVASNQREADQFVKDMAGVGIGT